LSELEELEAMWLYVKMRDIPQARNLAIKARALSSRSILLHPHHETYALRGRVEARSCNPKEALADLEVAIKLAKHAGDERAAKDYTWIDPNDCLWGAKDKQ
jgi:hypothetical protein